ncbi:MAG: glucosaminidase domain-containing protein [Saprospiraceae bacterium]
MLKWIIVCGWMVISCLGFSQDRSEYIETYKDIAISEMMRTGIPASIKLAQAILESSCGKSDLACKANNHFGIKCGNDWKGKSYKKEDDDYEDGKLVKSCFREFNSVWDSYLAHSDFLTDPGKSHRYGFLFKLEATDYKGWAKGLSKAGYATDPQYAERLIDIIDKNKLFMFDVPLPDAYVSNPKQKHKSEKTHTKTRFSNPRYHNDVKYDLAKAGDTPLSIAERNDVTPKQVVRYNDDIGDEFQVLAAGSRVYLQPKRNQNNGKQKVHLLKPGEDLVMVSQQYGIRLEALMKRNELEPNEVPAPNQKIVLKGKSKNKIRTVNPYAPPSIPQEDKNEEDPVTVASVKNEVIVKPKETRPDTSKKTTTSLASAPIVTKPAPIKPVTPQNETAHIVAKGDTLYSVSRFYGVPVAELKKVNNLSVDTIFIGQKLLLP